MRLDNHFRALSTEYRRRASRWILAHRIRARHPSLICDPTAIWDYAYDDIDAIEIGKGVSVLANAVIIVQRHSSRSRVEGKLILSDGAAISAGSNIRAAGGVIRFGKNSGCAQNCIVLAANHLWDPDGSHGYGGWDEETVGVDLEDNVFIGASSVLLPGTRIGQGAAIAPGSLVHKVVPPRELWGGWPARKIKKL